MHVMFEELESRLLASASPVPAAAWARREAIGKTGATPASSLAAYIAARYQAVVAHQPQPPVPAPVTPSPLPVTPSPAPPPAAIDVYAPEPSDSGIEVAATGPLFAPGGPVPQDVNQRQIADCYLLADLVSWAAESPAFITGLVRADSTPGEYVVTFDRKDQITRVHVMADFPAFAAQPGSDGAIWAQVIEKAYAYFRTGADTYASLNVGSAAVAAADFGARVASLPVAAATPQVIGQTISTALANHEMLVADTWPSAGDLVPSHSYAITGLTVDASGVSWVTLENPWGFDDAVVSLGALQRNAFAIDYGM